jgi:hypothetical protein
MIQMEDGQPEVPTRRKFVDNVEEANGIGSSGNGHAKLLDRFPHMVACNRGGHLF